MIAHGAADESPLTGLEEWDDDVARRYARQSPSRDSQDRDNPARQFRDYRSDDTPPRIREFYRVNHERQTLAFVVEQKLRFLKLDRERMDVWRAIERLDELVDESDPDTELSQLQHLLQTAEAIRADGHPDWFVLAGLLHDVGKILSLWGEPQWAVVGDTFPVGCAFDDRIVLAEYFADNPDRLDPVTSTQLGIYESGCGLDRVHMSWGHDEYLYHVLRDYLPLPALYMIRYHSFYAAHREGAYDHLMDEQDRENFAWVRAFNPYDLYSKSPEPPKVDELMPYYRDLVSRYLPGPIRW
jgi:inositol oxygenase